jgi:hypothetical protein
MTRFVLAACFLAVCPAVGGAFLDDVLSTGPRLEDFLGTWTDTQSDNSFIARVVVSGAGPNHVRIHLFGRCQAGECDWGSTVGRNHSDDPDSDDVRSIAAEFTSGTTHKRLTLRVGPGKSLRFELVTDFDNAADGHDYETSGTLALAPPMAQAPTTAPTAAAAPAAATAAAPSVAPVISAPAALPVAAAETASAQEDCVPINLADLYVAPVESGWQLRDYDHAILNFGADKSAALQAQAVVSYYRFDEQCFIARPHAKMLYWRSAGEFPHLPMPGADCRAVHPAAVKVAAEGEDWKVTDGQTILINYGDDRAGAEFAASTIRTYRLTRQCFVASPNEVMQYWLAG